MLYFCNRSSEPAYTLHVYAPGLRKMKLFQESGQVCVFTVANVSYMSEYGNKTGEWTVETHPDGILDCNAWNRCVIPFLVPSRQRLFLKPSETVSPSR